MFPRCFAYYSERRPFPSGLGRAGDQREGRAVRSVRPFIFDINLTSLNKGPSLSKQMGSRKPRQFEGRRGSLGFPLAVRCSLHLLPKVPAN